MYVYWRMYIYTWFVYECDVLYNGCDGFDYGHDNVKQSCELYMHSEGFKVDLDLNLFRVI